MRVGRWALVTGASGGLGGEFAFQLAERGINLVLAARREDQLEALAKKLQGKFDIQIQTETVDLSNEGAATDLNERIVARGITLDFLINNAGQGLHGDFLSQSMEATEKMLRLNILGLTALTHAVASDMAKQGRGGILLVASMTAYMPSPTYAAYAASKSYVRNFGEALHAELAPKGVVVTVVSPGLMDTGFLTAAGQETSKKMRKMMITPRLAAMQGLSALFDGRQSVVAGTMNKIFAFATRLMTRRRQTMIMAQSLRS